MPEGSPENISRQQKYFRARVQAGKCGIRAKPRNLYAVHRDECHFKIVGKQRARSGYEP
jgi:hypothetical protein